ncbi:MAG TPA: CBS domain-containing protein, partial [Candidatus Marinimicrobia bacterium]|nr:CBS domain-containing protein [Candidatus Neomarinimicrobiota bacterium]
MTENFDDELARMDELEEQADSAIFEALLLDDPIRGLTLRHHPTVQSGSTLQSVIDILRNEKVGCVMVEKDNQIIGVMTERDFLLRAI